MVIFHSYVSLPEGKHISSWFCLVCRYRIWKCFDFCVATSLGDNWRIYLEIQETTSGSKKCRCTLNQALPKPEDECLDLMIYIIIYTIFILYNIYIYVEGTFMYRMTGFGKIPHNTYNNCPKANFDFICRRSTLSHFHLSSEDLRTSITIHSIGKASLKSDLLTHLLFNGSSNSWVHFLWLSFKFAVIFILACLAFVHVLLESILNSNWTCLFRFLLKFACKDQFPSSFSLKLFPMFVGIVLFRHAPKTAAPLWSIGRA